MVVLIKLSTGYQQKVGKLSTFKKAGILIISITYNKKLKKVWGGDGSYPPKTLPFIHRGDMRLAKHKDRKKTPALPNRPKPLGVMRSLTDEFVKWETGNGKRGTGNGERGTGNVNHGIH